MIHLFSPASAHLVQACVNGKVASAHTALYFISHQRLLAQIQQNIPEANIGQYCFGAS